MDAELLGQRHDVVAGLQSLDGHSAKFLRIPADSLLPTLQFLSLQSVPQRVVSNLGVSPLGHNSEDQPASPVSSTVGDISLDTQSTISHCERPCRGSDLLLPASKASAPHRVRADKSWILM